MHFVVTNAFLFMIDLSLDAMDSAGDQHLHIEHNIYKRRVDLDGNPIEEAKKENISVPIASTSTSKPTVSKSATPIILHM